MKGNTLLFAVNCVISHETFLRGERLVTICETSRAE